MSTENEKTTEKKEMNPWVRDLISSVIHGVVFGIVIVFLERMGWI